MHRLYVNEDITVFWNSDKCFHARRCISGQPGVFNFARKPWIDLSKAQNPEIWKTVKLCPSGALDIIYNHGIKVELDEENHRSIALDGDKIIGECDYEDDGKSYTIYHTEVGSAYNGKGIARRLVYRLFEAAERKKRQVVPTCSYAAKIFNQEEPKT